MKQKLLFVMGNLNCGGAEKSLISLLQSLDYSKYEIDLFLFKHEGLFFSRVPEQVHILEEPEFYRHYDMPVMEAVKDSLKKRRPGLAIHRIRAGLIFRTETHPAVREQRVWKHLSKSLPRLTKRYDAAIGFMEKSPLYYVIEKANATTKIGFIHNDYDKLGMDPAIDEFYFRSLDYLVTVSDECGSVLKNRFPDLSSKVQVIQNIVSPELIHKMSQEEAVWSYPEGIKLLSIGRLTFQKGFEWAVEACRRLVDLGYDIRWYVIGEGEERSSLEKLIAEYSLQRNFILLGLKDNPYPYIKEADIYVQSSRFEGKSIAIDEAKIMCKPIIVTDFSTAKDQIQDHYNGLIVDMSPEGLTDGIRRLIDDRELGTKFARNLAEEDLNTESEVEKIYQLVQ